jgi:hypothetical protein
MTIHIKGEKPLSRGTENGRCHGTTLYTTPYGAEIPCYVECTVQFDLRRGPDCLSMQTSAAPQSLPFDSALLDALSKSRIT